MSSAAGIARAVENNGFGLAPLTQPGPRHEPARILLVEDLGFVRHVMAEVLTAAGYRLLVAKSAGEALPLCTKSDSPIDLLISDVVLPGKSGRHLALEFINLFPLGRVLLMSGHHQRLAGDACLDGPVDLVKPFSAEILLQKVRCTLETSPQATEEVHCVSIDRGIDGNRRNEPRQ